MNNQPTSIPLPPKVRAIIEGYVLQQQRIGIAMQATVDTAAAALGVPDGYSLALDNLDAGFTRHNALPLAAEVDDENPS